MNGHPLPMSRERCDALAHPVQRHGSAGQFATVPIRAAAGSPDHHHHTPTMMEVLRSPQPAQCRKVAHRLATARPFAYIAAARGPGGRGGACSNEESPGSTEQRCRVTPGRRVRLPRDSATESIPLALGRVRSKGCGKSAPRGRQRHRHGKPHRVQDRIGAAYGLVPARRPGWLLERRSNPSPRGMVAALIR